MTGRVLDIACMVGVSKEKISEKYGNSPRPTYSGARTTAARESSLYGTSIKVSEDGPISIWHHGDLIAEVG